MPTLKKKSETAQINDLMMQLKRFWRKQKEQTKTQPSRLQEIIIILITCAFCENVSLK